jgi:hypothetical protein
MQTVHWEYVVLAVVVLVSGVAWGQDAPAAIDWRASDTPRGAEVQPFRVRIVDFGDDFAWHYAEHTYRGANQFGVKKPDVGVDVDGDGDTKDDAVSFFEFSLDKPLNPLPPCWDMAAANARFYGIANSNRKPTSASLGW